MSTSSKPTVKALDEGQLDLMWQFLQMGRQKSDIPALKEHLDQLRQAMIQKTAGQRRDDPKSYVPLEDVGTIVNCIVIETMCLYLSGDLDKLEALVEGAVEKATPAWIPTSERLPEAGGTYLCVWQGKTVDTGFFCNGHFRLYGEIKDHLITHWMPLPELPSVNGKETEHDPEREG
jgi:hypothetical protein